MSLPCRAIVGPSRFTHVGRHHWFLRTLFASCSSPPTSCILVGCGPVEPILVASLMSTMARGSTIDIYAIDRSEEVVGLLASLWRDGRASLDDLATICRDDYEDPSSSLNTNFTNRIRRSLGEITAENTNGPFTATRTNLLAKRAAGVRLHSINASAEAGIARLRRHCDVAYLGLLLTDLRKRTQLEDTPIGVLRALRRLVPDGLIGIGGSLSPAHGVGMDLLDVLDAGFQPHCVALENIVRTGDRVYGDYSVLADAGGHRLVVGKRTGVCTPQIRLSSHLVSIVRSPVEVAELLNRSAKEERLVIAAYPTGAHRWQIESIEIADVLHHLLEDHRLWFSPLEVAHR